MFTTWYLVPGVKELPRASWSPRGPPHQRTTSGTAASAPSATTLRLSSAPCATYGKEPAPGSPGSTPTWWPHSKLRLSHPHRRQPHPPLPPPTRCSSAEMRVPRGSAWATKRRSPRFCPRWSPTRRSGNQSPWKRRSPPNEQMPTGEVCPGSVAQLSRSLIVTCSLAVLKCWVGTRN